eukprot:NODE_60_length_27201_cov_1.043318.p18 type:complete len:198 gc:universal NODE_60_length_27201_cov_1.043318:25323-25916(+)
MTYRHSVLQTVGDLFVNLGNSNLPQVKQAVFYGIGVLARVDPVNSNAFCQKCVPLLINNIRNDPTRKITFHGATDNAVASLVKIMKYCNVSSNEILQAIFEGLPLMHDDEEFPEVYSFIFHHLNQQFASLPVEKQVNILIQPILQDLTEELAPSFKNEYAHVFHTCLQNPAFKASLEQIMKSVSEKSQRDVETFFAK